MPKYLMIDHGGVFEGDPVEDVFSITEEDLIVKEPEQNAEWPIYHVLRRGVRIIQDINALIRDHDYQLVFHSKNKEATQLEFLAQLRGACAKKELTCPEVTALGAYDPQLFPIVNSSNPGCTKTMDDISVASWGTDDESGKASLRRALEKVLRIDESHRPDHIVFDDGEPVARVAQQENYRAFLIGVGEGRVTLDQALHQVLEKELGANEEKHSDEEGRISIGEGIEIRDMPVSKGSSPCESPVESKDLARDETDKIKRIIAPYRIDFMSILHRLRLKIKELEGKADPAYQQITQQMRTLSSTLRQQGKDFFTQPSPELFHTFRDKCSRALFEIQAEAGKHRGWHEIVHPFLRGFLGIVAALTVIPALVVQLKSGYVTTFFAKPDTKTLSEIKQYDQFFDKNVLEPLQGVFL